MLGFTSVGSGALIGLAFVLVFRLTPRRMVGTDVFHAAIVLWVATLVHLATGDIDFGLMGNILLGSLPGIWIGTGLATRVSSIVLRPAISAALLASSLAILDKGGVGVPPGVILGLPAAAGLVSWAIIRRRERRTPLPSSATAL